jgi:ribulose-phosphate 3-epimerase
MIIISPSLLACDFLNIESELTHLSKNKNIWLHLDIMDGHFVPNLTFGRPIIELIAKKTDIPLDAHFMVTNPRFHAETLKNAGLYNFTFHLESMQGQDSLEFISFLKTYYKSVGISIKPNTPESKLTDDILKLVDLVLVMSVEPGFGGQSFMPIAFDKIKNLKNRREDLDAHFQIQVDGGILDKNASELVANGADNLVAGSYIFKGGPLEYSKSIESLR